MPAVDRAHLDLPGGQQGPEQHRHGLGAGQHGLGLDPTAEFLVQALYRVCGAGRFPLRRIEAGEAEEAITGFLEDLEEESSPAAAEIKYLSLEFLRIA